MNQRQGESAAGWPTWSLDQKALTHQFDSKMTLFSSSQLNYKTIMDLLIKKEWAFIVLGANMVR